MAIKLFERYGPRANPADGDYPNGSIKNESSPGTDDGTPLEKDWGNDYEGFTAALLAEAGITASGSPDTVNVSQRLQALLRLTAKPIDSMVTLRTTEGSYDGQPVQLLSYYSGWSAVTTPPLGGGLFLWDESSTDADNNGSIIAVTGVPTGRWVRQVDGFVTPHMFGKQYGVAVDATDAVNDAIQAHNNVYLEPDDYRMNGAIIPKNDTVVSGVRGKTVLLQFGQYLVDQQNEDLERFVMTGVTFDFRDATASRYYEAFKLKAHRYCEFTNFEFIRYDDQTIMTRMPTTSATINTIDNKYADWRVSACAHLDIAIGLEGYYHTEQGDGVKTVFNTGVVWPEQFNSSVVVMVEDSDRRFNEQTLTTDYTVSYDGSNVLTITLSSPLASNERIHIWPSQPRTDGNRRPLSNNSWSNIHCDFVFVAAHTAVRWVDAEDDTSSRYLLAANDAIIYNYNPYLTRKGEGGDFMTSTSCVLSYQSGLVGDPSTLTGFHLGPGSKNIVGLGVIMDLTWEHAGVNRSIDLVDGGEVTLTGTVSITSGLPTVTGVGTKFRDELTLVGAVPDVVIIDGVKYGISSIDSDTQLTLLTNANSTLVGENASRYNFNNRCSYDMLFSGTGDGQTNANDKTMGHYYYNSNNRDSGEATILNGNTFVTVPFELARTPKRGEINVNAFSGIAGRSIQISNITSNSFRINVSSAAVADYDFGWEINLKELN